MINTLQCNFNSIDLDRIKTLKNDMLNPTREISLERALLYTESYKQTAGMSVILKRAKAVAHILDNVAISIREGELLAGNRTVKPRSGIVSPEMDPYWILKEIDTIDTRPQDQFHFSEENKKIYREELYSYWQGKSMKDFIMKKIDRDIQKSIDEEVVSLNQTDKGQGHIILDFPTILRYGIGEYCKILKEKIADNPENEFLIAALIVFEAFSRHCVRYAELAKKISEQETSGKRREELLVISSMCTKLSKEKPANLQEGLQLVWLTSIAAQYESNASSMSLGRMDQYLFTLYQHSIEEGYTKETILSYLIDFFIKTNDVVILRSQQSAKSFAGFPVGYNIALGGLDSFGRSAVNELSYLFLEAYEYVKMPQPNLSVRMNELIPQKFLNKTCETIRMGTGIPQLFNDEVCVPAFLSKGVSLEDARDYAIVGCVEVTIPGRTYGLHDIAMFNFLRVMELTMYSFKGDETITYDKLYRRMKERISYYVELVTRGSDIVDLGHREFAPTPFLSSLVMDCLEKGLDLTEGGARYNFSGIQGIGQANLSDSMYVLKKMVFENKEITFEEMLEAMENNYEGKYADLQEHVINDFDKYGNDNDEIDFVAADMFKHYAVELDKYTNIRGGKFNPGAYTVSAHIPLGEAVGATPDGRKKQEQLADGGLSAMVGRDRLGPTAVLKTVSKLDNMLMVNGSLLNLKFQPNTLKGKEGIEKFANFLRAYTKLKIQHIQFNVQTRETLLEAQKNPENYRGLVVRVAGYSAFFVDLNEKIQNDIIARTEHVL